MNNVVSLNRERKRLYTANDIAEMFSVARSTVDSCKSPEIDSINLLENLKCEQNVSIM